MSKEVETKAKKTEDVKVQDSDEAPIKDLVPAMDFQPPAVPADQAGDISRLVSDDLLMGIYNETLENLRSDREQVGDYLDTFADMVINDGDSTTSSKEAMVALAKLKMDSADKIIKIIDLMTRMKMKEKDTYKPYMNAHQTNNFNFGEGGGSKRALLERIEKEQAAKRGKK